MQRAANIGSHIDFETELQQMADGRCHLYPGGAGATWTAGHVNAAISGTWKRRVLVLTLGIIQALPRGRIKAYLTKVVHPTYSGPVLD